MKVRCSNNIAQINEGIFNFAKDSLGLDVDRCGSPNNYPYLAWDDTCLVRCNDHYMGEVMSVDDFIVFLKKQVKKTTYIGGYKIEIQPSGLIRIGDTTFNEESALQLAEYLKQNIKND